MLINRGEVTPTVENFVFNHPVRLTGGGGIRVAGAVTINGAVTCDLSNGGSPYTFNKYGAGTLTLNNIGASTALAVYGGTVRVNNLNLPSNSTGPSINLSAGTLTGAGTVDYLSAATGTHVAPGGAEAPGTLTSKGAGMAFYSGSILDYRLGVNASDKIVFKGSSAEVFSSGAGVLTVNFADAGGLAPGQTYTLFDWGRAYSNFKVSSFRLGSSPVGGTFAIVGSTLQFTTAAYTPLQQWQSRYFGSINAANAALTANPAGDGISNLMKYALGLDPTRPAADGLPKIGRQAGFLTLTYTKSKAATDVTYTLQQSHGLPVWSGAGITQEVLSDDGTTQTLLAKTPLDGSGRQFMRLSVAKP